jgi:hypothetical protein
MSEFNKKIINLKPFLREIYMFLIGLNNKFKKTK